ncbi:MAG: hypothetical protein GKS06_12850 [Acidobacteria bacterium]|nr:hypothetical protein [Acidobacteriota bacterium]
MNWVSDAVIFLIPVVGTVSLFSFLAVATWADARRKERESYYRYEFRKQLVDAGKMDANDVRDLMQYEQEANLYRSRQGSVVGGFVLMGTGIGMLFGLRWIEEGIASVGLIPLSIGVALTVYAIAIAPRSVPTPPASFGPPRDQ